MFNPNVDWVTGQLHRRHIIIETGLFQSAWEIMLNRIVALAREQPEWEEGDEIITSMSDLPMHAAQDWAIEANKHKQPWELPEKYQHHQHIFLEEGANCFPPAWPDDVAMKLKPGTPDVINCKIYPMTRAELAEWKDFVDKNLALQRIKKSKFKWTVPVFFIKKKDGSFRLVQDYHKVNKWTECDNYPLPRIEQILEQLHKKVIFTMLDIWDGYNNI